MNFFGTPQCSLFDFSLTVFQSARNHSPDHFHLYIFEAARMPFLRCHYAKTLAVMLTEEMYLPVLYVQVLYWCSINLFGKSHCMSP